MLNRIISIVGVILVLGSVSYAQESQSDSDLKFGKELFQNKMYDLAEEQFSKFLRQYPASPSAGQARYYLAMSQYDQDKFATAATNFQAFAVQYPNDPLAPNAWMNAGDSYAKVKDYTNAGLSYERLRVFYPKDISAPNALLSAAKYFELAGDTARAEVSLLTVVQDYSTTSSYFDATLQLGNLYFGSGKLLQAENQYRALLTSDNDSVRVMGLLALGKLNRMRGMPLPAERYLKDAIALNIAPQSLDAALENIDIDLDAGNFSSALQQANQIEATKLSNGQKSKLKYEKTYAAIALGSQSASTPDMSTLPPKYQLSLASLLSAKGYYTAALSLLRNIAKVELTSSDLDFYSETAFRAGRIRLSDSLLTMAAAESKKPEARLVVRLLDIENNYLNDPEKTRETFFRYENILKGRPDAYAFYRARSEEGAGNYTAAVEEYSELLSQYPESDYAEAADSLRRYDRDFKEVNYRDAVVSLADILLEQGSADRTSALLHLGNLYENELKDYGKAAKVYDKLAAIATGDTQRTARYLYAGALEKNGGRNSDVLSIYQQLSADSAADSVAERSLFHAALMESASGDSLGAESSALQFIKRFPDSRFTPRAYIILAEALYGSGAYHEAIGQATLAGPAPEAQLIIAKSEIAIDSLADAKATLESLLDSGPPRKTLLEGQLLYADVLQRLNLDATQTYMDILGTMVPSKYKSRVAARLADYLYASGKYDSAYSVYRTIGADQLWHRTPASTLYKMAYCKLKAGDQNGAKELFQEVAAASTDSSEVLDSFYRLGKIYASLGDRRMSASFLERAGSSNPQALVEAADIYFGIADYGDASRVYRNILSAAADDTLRTYSAARLVEIGYLTDRVNAADLNAAKFKKTYPHANDKYFARFLVDKAEYFIRNKKYVEARKLLDDVRSDYDRTPAYPQSILDQARIFVEQSDLAKAAEKLKELIDKFPAADVAPEAHLELGNIYYAQEKYQDASDNFRFVYLDSLAERNVVRDAMSRLISCYESLGMYDGALDITRKFIAMFPDDKSIMDKRIKVGILYEELRYFDQALITFQSLVKEANRDYQAELHYYIGAIYDDKGDYANAILEFLKVPYLVTPSAVVDWAAQAYYMAGKCYEQLNKPNEAIAMYQKIVDKPNTDPTFIAGAEREINRVKALLK